MPPRQKILLVEDTPALARTYQGFLRAEPYDIEHVETGGDAMRSLDKRLPAAVLLDLKLPDMSGMEVLHWLRTKNAACPVIVITAHGSIDTAVEATRAGADDFLVKPFNAERLKVTLRNVCEKQVLADIVETYRTEIDRHQFEGFIGSSLAMQSVYRCIESAASSAATVFITGESGTGKEVAAQAVHDLSQRRSAPFVPLNCAAIPRDLMESEIFGHVKGAFTGATSDRIGAAGQAHKGTLFLDEICEMDPYLQSKLLRFLQSGILTKVGGSHPETVDVRFICATNRDPAAAVESGEFREDLFYRLHVIPIEIPPLRARGDDVLEIARVFLARYADDEGKRFAEFDDEVVSLFRNHAWPGNVRQLQNVIRNVVVLHDGATVTKSMLPDSLDRAVAESNEASAPDPLADVLAPGGGTLEHLAREIRPLRDVEREAIETAVALCGGDVRKAAVFLGVAPGTVYRKLKAWRP